MKKLIFIVLVLLPTFIKAQLVPGVAAYDSTRLLLSQKSYGQNWGNFAVRNSFWIPTDTVKLKVADSNAIAVKGNTFYKYNGYKWNPTAGGAAFVGTYFDLVRDGNADTTGSFDASAIVQQAIDQDYKYIYIPPGKYKWSNTVYLKDSVTITGSYTASILVSDQNQPFFKLQDNGAHASGTSVITGTGWGNVEFQVRNGGGYYSNICNLTFYGVKTLPNQDAIRADSVTSCQFFNLRAYRIGGFLTRIKKSVVNSAFYVETSTRGNMVYNNYVEASYGGFLVDSVTEYTTIANNTVNACTIAVWDNGGNNRIIGNNFSGNTIGGRWVGFGNAQHGLVSQNTFNHVKTIEVRDFTLGINFEDNLFFAEDSIVFKNASYVQVNGGWWLSANGIRIRNCPNFRVGNVGTLHAAEPSYIIEGVAPTLFRVGKANKNITLTDLTNNRDFNIGFDGGIARLHGYDSIRLANIFFSNGANDSMLVQTPTGAIAKRPVTSGSGGTITASNGLIKTGDDIALGGSMLNSTGINGDGKSLKLGFGGFDHPNNYKGLYFNANDTLTLAGVKRTNQLGRLLAMNYDSTIQNFGTEYKLFATGGTDPIIHAKESGLTLNSTNMGGLDSLTIKSSNLILKAPILLNGSYGSAGQVITSNGAEQVPTWQNSVSSQWTTEGANIYYNSGNVGIGTTTPYSALSVNGGVKIADSLTFNNGGFPANPSRIIKSDASTLRVEAPSVAISSNNAAGNVFLSQPNGFAILNSAGQFSINSFSPPPGPRLHVEGSAQVNGNLGVGTATAPVPSAALEVNSTTRGALLPKLTSAQLNAIASPAVGLLAYNTTRNRLEHYDSTKWDWVAEVPQTHPTNIIFQYDTMPATGLRSAFSLSNTTASMLGRDLRVNPTATVVTNATVNHPGVYLTSEHYTYEVALRVPVIGANCSFGIGTSPSQFRNAAGNRYGYSATMSFTNVNATCEFFTGSNGTFTSRATTAALTIATGDTVTIRVVRDSTRFTVTVQNLRTLQQQTTSYTYSLATTANPVMPVGGIPVLYNLSSTDTIDVIRWKLIDNIPQNCKVLCLTDSKGNYTATASANRWISRLNAHFGAGTAYGMTDFGGEIGDAIKAIGHIRRLRPEYLIISMGSNDVRNSVTEAVYTANLLSMINTVEEVGTKVIFLGCVENTVIQSTLFNVTRMLLGTRSIITTPALAGDGIHLTDAGHATVFNALLPFIKL